MIRGNIPHIGGRKCGAGRNFFPAAARRHHGDFPPVSRGVSGCITRVTRLYHGDFSSASRVLSGCITGDICLHHACYRFASREMSV